MQNQHHDHKGRAPVVQAAHPSAEGDFPLKIGQAIVGMVGRGDVVEGQEDPGDRLEDEHQKEHGAEGEKPGRAWGQGSKEESAQRPGDAYA